jgi:hypothetical protein
MDRRKLNAKNCSMGTFKPTLLDDPFPGRNWKEYFDRISVENGKDEIR